MVFHVQFKAKFIVHFGSAVKHIQVVCCIRIEDYITNICFLNGKNREFVKQIIC